VVDAGREQARNSPPLGVVPMNERSPVLVTGATGKLGTAVCQALLERGYAVRATDRQFVKGFPVRIELGDLCDELFVYRTMEGCSAVMHAGNHPNQFVGLSAPRILSDNVAMNANVFHAAVDHGVESIVFASSVQAMIRRERNVTEPPYSIPVLPLDGELPANPGANTYAQSKEFAERMLELIAARQPALSLTAIRYPMLVTAWFERRMSSVAQVPLKWLDLAECTAHLFLEDAGALVADVLARRLPGYRRYFPAQTMDIANYPVEELLANHYADVPRRAPIPDLASLIDISAITRDVGWVPKRRLRIAVER
jgi:nucleoside-diphosphate-sugar epimerase